MSDASPQAALRFLTLGIELTTEENACLNTIHDTLDRLTQRRKDRLPITGTLDPVLRQVILYRIVATASGTIVNWNTGNVLCSFLTARALFETFAFLWDYRRAIDDAETGTLTEFNAVTERRLAATKSPTKLARNPEWEATNILTFINRMSKQHPWASRAYELMSSRYHPNTEGMLDAFADIETETKEIRFSDRNDQIASAFRLILGVTGLVAEAERLLDELENVTQSIAEKIKDRDFKKRVDEADREEKRFEQFGIDEENAFLGDARGQFAIGKAHAVGGGTILRDLFRSYFWLTLAAAQGIKEAKHYRDRIAKQVTPQQIGEAEALAASWKPMTPDEWERHNEEIITGLCARFEPP